jgi:hypothetical protein
VVDVAGDLVASPGTAGLTGASFFGHDDAGRRWYQMIDADGDGTPQRREYLRHDGAHPYPQLWKSPLASSESRFVAAGGVTFDEYKTVLMRSQEGCRGALAPSSRSCG